MTASNLGSGQVTPGLNATSKRKLGYEQIPDIFQTFNFQGLRNSEPSVRSKSRHRVNIILSVLLALSTFFLFSLVGFIYYRKIIVPNRQQQALEDAIREHAVKAAERAVQCRGIDWETACDTMTGSAGARRQRNLYAGEDDRSSELEDNLLYSDDPTVTYDSNCLRIYRLNLFGNITFPYYAGQLLQAGGNYTMALFIQHGALRNSENYFCSFKKLMQQQQYRPFEEILIISPSFNYETDDLVHPLDAWWNSSKPWGDWRVGAESDPRSCGNRGWTISSFEILDTMLAMLTNKRLFPNMNKISYVGHSAGGQMVQRYAVTSVLAALWDYDEEVDVHFIIANPSSYAYLDERRFGYNCGNCKCDTKNCTCDKECTRPPYYNLSVPKYHGVGTRFPCYQWNYNQWPYGLGSFSDRNGHYIPYALRDGQLGVERAVRMYRKLHVIYMVGQNDTCNDGLSVCEASCWKRENFSDGEWPCFRNDMDTRCPAMLQGPCRRTRAQQYMRYLEDVYGKPTHELRTIPGVGHDASPMFGSPIGMKELFA